ncbi:pre-mRNA-processing factor 17 isoform X2 [Prunus yedoensis var. nudiflora]|uniref:Pre-mRNA-processing factor 17 isoform X2 n=1 Tax=Prunus yedoensis var. nudiflora TaxID=2094558 RepID=A0A314XM98_PRUYE|nr:pre-mRNA-processing factor 17 isoform X2 [Prunus yedoensis var. nudiflora]
MNQKGENFEPNPISLCTDYPDGKIYEKKNKWNKKKGKLAKKSDLPCDGDKKFPICSRYGFPNHTQNCSSVGIQNSNNCSKMNNHGSDEVSCDSFLEDLQASQPSAVLQCSKEILMAVFVKITRLPEQKNQNPSSTTSSPKASPPRLLLAKSAAPNVDGTMLALTVADGQRFLSRPIDPTQHIVGFNPTYDQLWAPIYGPSHPYAKDGITQRNHKLGFVEDTSIEPFIFDEQYNTFHKYGYTADPSASAGYNYVGDFEAVQRNQHSRRRSER